MAELRLMLLIFFGVALLIGLYFTWILLRDEAHNEPQRIEDPEDYGFGPPPARGGPSADAPPDRHGVPGL